MLILPLGIPLFPPILLFIPLRMLILPILSTPLSHLSPSFLVIIVSLFIIPLLVRFPFLFFLIPISLLSFLPFILSPPLYSFLPPSLYSLPLSTLFSSLLPFILSPLFTLFSLLPSLPLPLLPSFSFILPSLP